MNSDAARLGSNVDKAATAFSHGPEIGGSLSLTHVTSTEFQPRLHVETMSVAVCAQCRRDI